MRRMGQWAVIMKLPIFSFPQIWSFSSLNTTKTKTTNNLQVTFLRNVFTVAILMTRHAHGSQRTRSTWLRLVLGMMNLSTVTTEHWFLFFIRTFTTNHQKSLCSGSQGSHLNSPTRRLRGVDFAPLSAAFARILQTLAARSIPCSKWNVPIRCLSPPRPLHIEC